MRYADVIEILYKCVYNSLSVALYKVVLQGGTDTDIKFIKFIKNFCYKIDVVLIHIKKSVCCKIGPPAESNRSGLISAAGSASGVPCRKFCPAELSRQYLRGAFREGD